MKKCASKVLAAAMVATMMMPGMSVFAASNEAPTAKTNVKYTVDTAYEWSVPTEINFNTSSVSDSTTATVEANADSGATQKVKVTKNVIPAGQKLQITAEGSGVENAFTIVPEGKNNTLAYDIKVGNSDDALSVGGVVLEVAAGVNTGSTNLTFTLKKDITEKADDYKGTVTYTSSVVSAN